jgi:uncharacterized membrane protein
MPDTPRDDKSLSHTETITAVIHYYRAESARALAWRERLDRTTNWAVAATAAFLGFAYSHPEITHAAFVFGLAMVYILLFVEARRFRFYDAYEYRVRLLHQEFVANLLKGSLDFSPGAHWRIDLADDLLHPRYKMGALEAIGQRIHANYIYLFGVLLAGWLLKIKLHPLIARSWNQYLEQAAIGGMPGIWTFLFIAAFAAHLVYLRYVGQKAKGGRDLIYPRQGG